MESVKEILHAYGYNTVEDLETCNPITVENPGFMDLVIEKIGDKRISVAHYYTQNGDLMSDPEIVFKINDEEWIPVRYTEHPHIHGHDETGIDGVKGFVSKWDKSLQAAGFVEKAKESSEG